MMPVDVLQQMKLQLLYLQIAYRHQTLHDRALFSGQTVDCLMPVICCR